MRTLLVLMVAVASPRAYADDEPTIATDTVFLTAVTNTFDLRGQPPDWLPILKFKVNGPIPDGSRIHAEVSYPGKKGWLKADCGYKGNLAGQTSFECDFPKNRTRFVGAVEFAIHLSNELQGKNVELFRGQATVARTAPLIKGNPASANYYVNDDWRVPIGYLSTGRTLELEMYFRGRPGEARPYLFSGGKQVAAPENCGSVNFEPTLFEWWPVRCEFFAGSDSIPKLAPGDYEIRVLQQGKLVRTATFKVNAEGSYDNGIATTNKLGTTRVVIPMKTIVDHVPWDKQAYKAGAFYGHPMTGFAVP